LSDNNKIISDLPQATGDEDMFILLNVKYHLTIVTCQTSFLLGVCVYRKCIIEVGHLFSPATKIAISKII